MRNSNSQPLKDVLNLLLKRYQLDTKLNEYRLVSSWEKVMGKMIAKHTEDLYIKNKTLYVKLNSAALRNELSFAKDKMVKMLNEEIGFDVITHIDLK
jgi:predicted nucleic acid-binding Zn ribbon protein